MALIPRNPKDWSACFAQGNALTQVELRPRGASKNYTILRLGDFGSVILKPSGNQRDDAFLKPDKEWIAQLWGIAFHEDLGPLAELRWFLASAELPLEAHQAHNSMMASLGELEIVALHHHTYDFVDNISSPVTIQQLSVTEPSSPLCPPGTRYTRPQLQVFRYPRANGDMAHRLETGNLICKEDCLRAGLYYPDQDVLRYCEQCQTFYHIDCLEVSPNDRPTLLPPHPTRPDDLEVEPDDREGAKEYTFLDYCSWQRWLCYPLERGCGAQLHTTFERVVLAIRREDRARGCPAKPRVFLTQTLDTAVHEAYKYQVDTLVHRFQDATEGDMDYYLCPKDVTSI
ncbi:hypothetical protein PYCCODRAFT_1429277 [Trametes coccinea BRFM310]|uniref:BAH domain-containing protein n=1 Tax=Trametes coccinea (strain BRFM310) TaxID=1353009 RepID=A0A1Y2I8A9_TRAC3|nr:hypothetical protein PYCCODRAFT_1429277 [Trametes coccinea BRFM310]